ncbi:MAG: COX15/CtaA family protein [Acidimicrobiia bacterium]|nr:COX15/CtaA family protein [Acidimicrobiia bacterium]
MAVTTVLLGLIVVSGATVRLTKAGLGCTEWPECHDGQLLPSEQDLLGKIEYGNRLFSGIIGLFTLAVAFEAWRLRRRMPTPRPDLLPWAMGLIAGSVAQILLGRAVVVLELDPIAVAGHYLLSAVMVWNAIVLWLKTGSAPGRATPRVGPSMLLHSRMMVGLISLVLVVGTMVTGTGPNSGDSRAERLGLEFSTIARVHSLTVWCFLLTALWLSIRLQGSTIERLPRPNLDPLRLSHWLLVATVVQGALGYWQYLTGVPAVLVWFHILGSVAVWSIALLLRLSLFARRPAAIEPGAAADRAGVDSVDVSADVEVDVEPV